MKKIIAVTKGDGCGPEVVNEDIKILNTIAEYSNYDWGNGDKAVIDFNKRLKSDITKSNFKKATGKKLQDEREALEGKCDTLDLCKEDDGCSKCDVFKKIDEIDNKIEELEDKIEDLVGTDDDDDDE